MKQKMFVIVAAIVAMLGFAIPAAASHEGIPKSQLVQGTLGQASACSVWQYSVVEYGTIRDVPGGGKIGHARFPDLVNVRFSNDTGGWYWGNFYHVPDSGSRVWFNRGWILKSHLRYTGHCW